MSLGREDTEARGASRRLRDPGHVREEQLGFTNEQYWKRGAAWRLASAGTMAVAVAAVGCGEPAPAGETNQRSIAADRAARPDADEHTVTLITGDRVTLRGGSPVVTPGPGRRQISFMVQRDGDRVAVIPSDAAPLIASGQLDGALFEVSQLIADGYGDDKRDDLPLIITGAGDAAGFARSLTANVRVEHMLPVLRMVTVRQAKRSGGAALAGVRALTARKGIVAAGPPPKVWLDRVRKPLLDHSVPQIGGPAAHARGFTGAGITVAVLDTGIDSTHPDLVGKVIAAEDFTGDGQGVLDVVGHGTHVASTIAGTGAASDGRLAGVAPDAQLISGRVCDVSGCPDSAILAGMEWAAAEQHAKIINLSLGGTDTPELDPIEQAVNDLSAQLGTLFVIAAGNTRGAQTIESPGSADAALTVGAVDAGERLAFFSSQGPRLGDDAIKPDVTAPGVGIVAARATGVPPIGPPVGESYMSLSGTSMATPHVAGAAALLLQQHPTWTGTDLKAQLMASANPNPALDVFAQGAGRIDIDRGTRQDVAADPPTLSLGTAAFPHGDDAPIVRTVRYRNGGSAPITLALTATLSSPAGPGSISAAPATITVPAGGGADVVVTTRTDGDLADGIYTGALVATGGDVRVETPVAVEREAEAFNLTLQAVSDGAPASAFVSITPTAGERLSVFVTDPQTIRLPRGQYAIDADVLVEGPTFLTQPRLQLDHDQTLTLDAALAAPIDVDVSDPDVGSVAVTALYVDHATRHAGGLGTLFLPLACGQLGGALPADELVGIVLQTKSDQLGGASKIVYSLAHSERGQLPRGWQETLAQSQFATVDAHHGGRADAHYTKGALPLFDDSTFGLVGDAGTPLENYDGPFDRTERYYGPGFQFERTLFDERFDPDDPDASVIAAVIRSIRSFAPGEHLTEHWNEAPGGPGFASSVRGVDDTLRVHSNAMRVDNLLVLRPTVVGDTSPSHFVESVLDGRVTLSRNGTPIFEDTFPDAVVDVPPEPASYRLEIEADRPTEVFSRSTHVRAAWTFRSAHVDGERDLPLLTMHFLPALDDDGNTRARVLVLPIAFGRPSGAGTPFVVRAELEASFDDGAHWSRVPIAAFGDRALAVIVHPRGAHHVSLRSSATDLAGNSIEQTILRVYGVK